MNLVFDWIFATKKNLIPTATSFPRIELATRWISNITVNENKCFKSCVLLIITYATVFRCTNINKSYLRILDLVWITRTKVNHNDHKMSVTWSYILWSDVVHLFWTVLLNTVKQYKFKLTIIDKKKYIAYWFKSNTGVQHKTNLIKDNNWNFYMVKQYLNLKMYFTKYYIKYFILNYLINCS